MTTAVTVAADVRKLRLVEIDVPATARPCDPLAVSTLAESIASMGLQTAPTVVQRDGRYVLVAGRHRIEALKTLGIESVPVRLVEMDDVDARMWAISENLHRAELTIQDRTLQIDEYAGLAKRKRETETALRVALDPPDNGDEAKLVSAQVAPKRGRPQGGDRLAARDLGIPREEVARARKIARLSHEAIKEAEALGLDDNQSALLKAARRTEPADQVATLRAIHARGRVSEEPRGDSMLANAERPAVGPTTPRAKKGPSAGTN
jgi:ParB family chromosome partitioning protein